MFSNDLYCVIFLFFRCMGSSEGPAASTQAELNICMQTPNLTRKDVGEILQSFETIHVQCQTVYI